MGLRPQLSFETPAPPALPKELPDQNHISASPWIPLASPRRFPAWAKPKHRHHGLVGTSESFWETELAELSELVTKRECVSFGPPRETLPNGKKLKLGLHVTTVDSFSFRADAEFIGVEMKERWQETRPTEQQTCRGKRL